MSTNNSGLSLLRQLPKQLADLMKSYFEEFLRINKAPQIRLGATTDELVAAQERMRQQIATLKQNTRATIGTKRADAAKFEPAARSDIARRLGRPAPADSAEAQVRESREARAWARTRPLLDQVQPDALSAQVAELATEALASNDEEALAALRTELPAYARLRAGDKALGALLSAVLSTVLDHIVSQARPEIAEVLVEQQELNVGMPRMVMGFTYCEYAIDQNELSVIIPSWDPKQPNFAVQADPQ